MKLHRSKKALELPFSTIITVLILIITLIVLLILYASWQGQGISTIDKFFAFLRR